MIFAIIVFIMGAAMVIYMAHTDYKERKEVEKIKAGLLLWKERPSMYEVVQHAEEMAEIEYYHDHPEEKPKSPWPYVNITGIPDDFTVITNEVHIVLAAQPGVNLDLTWEGVPEARWVREDTENSTIFRLERKDK